MRKPYTPEIVKFIEEHHKGIYIDELVELLNKEFGTEFRYQQIKSYLSNHHMTNGMQHVRIRDRIAHKYSTEVVEWLREHAAGRTTYELAEMINQNFGIECTNTQIAGLMKNQGIKNGLDCRFHPGNVPATKGTKGVYNVGGNKTSFKKGQVCWNKKPIGTERISVDGYYEVKVADPNVWKLKHRIVYEQAHGPIPEGHMIAFIDGNPLNVELNNLTVVSRREHLYITQNGLIQKDGDSDLNRVGITTAKLMSKIYERKNDHGKN